MTSIVKLQSLREARGLSQHSALSRQTPDERSASLPFETTATVLLFTGVRYERMAEPRPRSSLTRDVTVRDVLELAD